jgi:hypothetical protein
MNWPVWQEIETLLVKFGIKPIMGVVPDNRDAKLMVCAPADDFWGHVRTWQARGWTIALHGYQHVYTNDESGLIGVTRQSEFASLPREVQREKLESGLAIFSEEGVQAECWIAPSHSFDWTTVDLLAELSLRVISDGLWLWPYSDRRGITWVPQQLWSGLRSMPFGVWTICYHHNQWQNKDIDTFLQDIFKYHSQIIDMTRAINIYCRSGRNLFDHFFHLLMVARMSPRAIFKHLKASI